jgi:hypothetical protein
MADPSKVQATIARATDLMRHTPGRAGSIVSVPSADLDDVLVVGDLHGHFDVLASVIRIAALDRHPRRHLIVQELVHDNRIDPDEGQLDRSHRAIDLLCALTCQFPGRVHYLLGNHELSELTGRSIAKKGHALNALFRAGVEVDYGPSAERLMPLYHALFRALPLVIRLPNRVVACHTVPDAQWQAALDRDLLHSGAWTAASMARGGAVYALTWSRDNTPEAADAFAAWIDADLFVCGHQACDQGMRQSSPRTLILDGTYPMPAYALFSGIAPLTIEQLVASARHVPLGGVGS